MITLSHRLFLLRAYGDATIALQFLVKSPEKDNYTIIASKHLQPLILALGKYINLSLLQIQFVDFGITKSQLNLFTNRHLISLKTLYQIGKLKKFIKNNPNPDGVDYLEQSHKSGLISFLLGHKFKTIANSNVYQEMNHFFKPAANKPNATQAINKILIVPDARIAERQIPAHLIHYINTKLVGSNKSLQVAYFNIATNNLNKKIDSVYYNNFEELLILINNADFIFGSDSLSIHLSYALQKPHYILYPKNGSKAFFTSFSLEYKYYADFEKFTSLTLPI